MYEPNRLLSTKLQAAGIVVIWFLPSGKYTAPPRSPAPAGGFLILKTLSNCGLLWSSPEEPAEDFHSLSESVDLFV